VAFFIGPSRSLDEDGWNGWSYTRVGSVVVPWLERYLDTHPDLPDEADESAPEDEDEEPEHVVSPMDGATLAYIAQYIDGWESTEAERARVHALSVRLGWES
jgi:hypothetical protein